MVEPFRWDEETQTVRLLDQTRLPTEEHWLTLRTPEEMAEAIRQLRVRGAPAIGLAASFGVVLAFHLPEAARDPVGVVEEAIRLLRTTRPTAVNLFTALDRMEAVLRRHASESGEVIKQALLEEARTMYREDQEACRQIGEEGLSLLDPGMSILTHCHTGGVATSGYGTALAVFHLAREKGIPLQVYATETRPLLQGARITTWELQKAGIPVTLITDSMAGMLMQQGKVDAVIVGADRVTANGDVANKIGTYTLAVLAAAHNIPFYVALPLSTVDMQLPHGGLIPIEERDPREITHGFGRQTAPSDVRVYNPAFDITPGYLVTSLITERGIIRPPYEVSLREVMEEAGLVPPGQPDPYL